MFHDLRGRAGSWIGRWRPETGDAVLYGASALFAALTAGFSTISLYRVWGQLSVGVYVVGAGLSLVLAATRPPAMGAPGERRGWRRAWSGRWRPARVVVFCGVLLGATVGPLAVEVVDTSGPSAAAHVQPEVTVIDQAGGRLAAGKDPYHAEMKNGRLVSAVPGEPAYESFFPYLPLMAVFGLPSSTHASIRLTDARLFFSLVTLLVVAVALLLCRGPTERKVRTLMVLTVLPTAALPLATGGDDLPVVAFLLLAMVLAQRREPFASGVVLGIVAAMKFTAWPLCVLAPFAAIGKDGRRAPWRMVLGMAVVVVPVVIPFIIGNPRAFGDNAILFPLGLAGVASPAASPLPGHLLVSAFPWLHRVLPATVAVVGGVILVRYLWRKPPSTAAQVCSIAGWVMLVAILVAPATRIGYLLYPINFFVWASLLRGSDRTARVPTDAPGLLATAA